MFFLVIFILLKYYIFQKHDCNEIHKQDITLDFSARVRRLHDWNAAGRVQRAKNCTRSGFARANKRCNTGDNGVFSEHIGAYFVFINIITVGV